MMMMILCIKLLKHETCVKVGVGGGGGVAVVEDQKHTAH
jgi:hypothetical protein